MAYQQDDWERLRSHVQVKEYPYDDIHSQSGANVLMKFVDGVGLVLVQDLGSVASRWDLKGSCLWFLDSCWVYPRLMMH